MPKHENGNGSRSYLADEVQAQRVEVTKIGKEVAANTLISAQILEANGRASAERENMRGELTAMRGEQLQVSFQVSSLKTEFQSSVADLKGVIADLKATVKDHETERQQGKGAWNLATASARTVGGIIIGVIIAISGFAMFVYKIIASVPNLFKSGGP